ncbi:serine protease nudel [Neocloeon triangulifer]|uniref:serine protease nudel n=1 Tax=Neocloeon triangulifer TaxID=2078957 RepID=UPI00286F8176|nr:serine protease nudel [Neocloeon triangulifer]
MESVGTSNCPGFSEVDDLANICEPAQELEDSESRHETYQKLSNVQITLISLLSLVMAAAFAALIFTVLSGIGLRAQISTHPSAVPWGVDFEVVVDSDSGEPDLLTDSSLILGRFKRSRGDFEDYGSGDGIVEEGDRPKRQRPDCDEKYEQINKKLEKVVATVNKINDRLSGSKELQQQSYTGRYPLCFFQPDPSAVQTDNRGQYFTNHQAQRGPVTCVFLPAPISQTAVIQEQGKNDKALETANRERASSTDQDSWPSKGLPLPHREKNVTSSAVSSGRSASRGHCEEGHVACSNGKCISSGLWCDASVDCEDASDEAQCNCRHRVDEVRLCDNYMDCPNGEDEISCHGCAKTEFSCINKGPHEKEHKCVPLTKRCDGVEDCTSGSDEHECFALLEELVNSGQVDLQSHISGYLHINIQGQWFPTCTADPAAALQACKAEAGPDVRSEEITMKIERIGESVKAMLYSVKSEGCKNREVAYVQCPLPKCGSRILDEAPIERPKRVVGGRIVGGKQSQPTAWPYLVAIFRDGRFHCGGSLITEEWVLSAAHCVHEYTKHFYEIQAGMLRRLSFSPQEQTRVVTHVIVHRDYNRQVMTNDLSLLKIDPPVRMSRWARHVCLPPPGLMLPEPGTTCITIGWGATKEHGSDPDQIHEVDVPILDNCKHIEDRRGIEICAGLPEGGKDACQGDSGGPLLCRIPREPERWYVAGVVSHGEGCARPNEPGAYTRVGIFLDWINYFVENEIHLPKEVPVAKCPSIECSRVGGRCLSASMVCDKIIDCLNAEDELNCKSFRAREDANSTFREDESSRPTPNMNEDKISKIYDDQRVKGAFQTLKDAGFLNNVTAGIMLPKFFLFNVKSNDSRVSKALKDLNETGVANIENPINVTRILDSPPQESSPVKLGQNSTSPGTNGSPSASEATLDSLDSSPNETTTASTDEPENKIGEIELPVDSSPRPSSLSPQTAASSTTLAPSPSPSTPVESKGGDLELNQFTSTVRPASNVTGIDAENKHLVETGSQQERFYCGFNQEIPIDRRCDSVKDCEDGSDERDCTCGNYLARITPALICNGELDCRDRSDERGCSVCNEDEYLCPVSYQCVKKYQICDRGIDCLYKEDERYCFALVNGPSVHVDQENRAVLRQDGFLVYKQGKIWYPVCQDRTDKTPEELAADICANQGFSYYKDVKVQPASFIALPEYQDQEDYYEQPNYGMLQEGAEPCSGLWVECGERLFTYPLPDIPPCGDATWSWFAAIFKEGKYLCGATLVNPLWVVTSRSCTQKIDLQYHYIGVIMGAKRLFGYEGPHDQMRRAVAIKDIEDVSFVQLDKPVKITRNVIPLTLPEWFERPDSLLYCMALGPSSVNDSIISIQFKPVYCEDNLLCLERVCSPSHHECEVPYASKPISWSGAVACQNSRGSWFPVAVFDEPLGSCGFKSPFPLRRIEQYIDEAREVLKYPNPPVAQPLCQGWRCPLGLCVPQSNLCDGMAECRDRSDESDRCLYVQREKFCLDAENPYTCVCGLNSVPCRNGYCVHKNQFCNGYDDCGDGSDEPADCKSCAAYLKVVDPSKICDGNRNCYDKSDESWTICGCSQGSYKCQHEKHCIPPTFVCDGEKDCPGGDDEKNCVAVRTTRSDQAVGEVLINTCGQWHEFCAPPGLDTKIFNVDSRDLCRQMGFDGSNARTVQEATLAPMQLPEMDMFYEVHINNQTSFIMRPSSRPLVQFKFSPCPTIVVLDCGAAN